MKGAGTTVESVFLLIIMMGTSILVFAIILLSDSEERRITLEEAEIIKVKSLAYMTNKSLAATWLVSTAQSLFSAEGGLDEEYWYRTDPALPKSIVLPEGKCNGNNPRICLPGAVHISEFMKRSMQRYADIKDTEISGGEIKVKEISFDKKNNFWPAYGLLSFSVAQRITVTQGNTEVNAITENKDKLVTNFRKMLFAGWLLVDMAMKQKSNDYDVDSRSYIENKNKEIESQLDDIAKWSSPLESSFTKETDLVVPADQSGLLLHYKIDAHFSEKAEGVISNVCTSVADYDLMIEGAVSSLKWEFGKGLIKIKFSNEEIVALVKSMIQQESSWHPDAERYEPSVGDSSYGLMQIIPKFHPECGTKDDLLDTEKNIRCGVNLIHGHLKEFAGISKFNTMKLALSGYNCGTQCVKTATGDDNDRRWEDIAADLPSYTQNYVPAVMSCLGNYVGEIDPNIDYKDALNWPADSRLITDCYGSLFGVAEGLRGGPHGGIDIAGNSGDPAYAMTNGEVVKVCTKSCGSYGNHIIIKHADNLYSLYAHLSDVLVKEKQKVAGRDIVGKIGSTGASTGPHLHFEVRQSIRADSVVNPCQLLSCSSCSIGEARQIDYMAFPSSSTENIYYYHDKAGNRFVKKPFSLNVKIEDFLPALDCSQNNGKMFSWQNKGDMICLDNTVWTCLQDISGLSGIKLDHETLVSGADVYKCLLAAGRFCKQGDDTRAISECCTGWTGRGTLCNSFCAGDGILDADEGCASADARPCEGTCAQGKTMTCTGTACNSKCECV